MQGINLAILIIFLSTILGQVNSECCYICAKNAMCHDCTLGTVYCAYGKCNMFGCDCSDGCRSAPSHMNSCDWCKESDRFDYSKSQTPTGSTNLPNWMSNLDDEKYLYELSIPGTHDTMSHYGGGAAECHQMRILTQLNAGIRAVDIRVQKTVMANELKVVHGVTDQKATLDDVLYDCSTFLRQNPTETIIMRIKKECQDSDNPLPWVCTNYGGPQGDKYFLPAIKWHLDQYQPKIYEADGEKIPKLKEVRGKIVVIADGYSFDGTLTWDGPGMDLQDEYKVPTLFDIPKKFDHVKEYLNKAKVSSSQMLYLNFVSGASLGAYPDRVANAVNGMVLKYFEDNPGNFRTGILFMDFPGKRLIQTIVELNGIKVADSYSESIPKDQNVTHTTHHNSSRSSFDIVSEIFAVADKDFDGKLNFQECITWVRQYIGNYDNIVGGNLAASLTDEHLLTEFEKIDTDQDGFINFKEIDP